MSVVPQSIYLVNGFVYSVLIPIYLTIGCIMPGNCFISCTRKISNVTGLYEEIGTWSYKHNVLYVKLRRTKDRLKYNI